MFKNKRRCLIFLVWVLANCIEYMEFRTLSREIKYPPLPESSKQYSVKYITFTVYTKKKPKGKMFNVGGKVNFIDTNKMTKILIHGWQNDDGSSMPQKLKDAYLKYQDVNIIVVGWGRYSKTYEYDRSVKARAAVAKATVIFIMNNLQVMQQELDIHLIGYSLGAHICGDIGYIFKYNGRTVFRITGLDPARPLIKKGLRKENALFVDVIHTTAGSLGTWIPSGHVDFYPNGGSTPQPKCNHILPQCSHASAWKYFAESIKNRKRYRALRCSSFQYFMFGYCTQHTYMGEGVSLKARGSYYLNT
ncbi:hypothetical protein Trydic_g15479 [Trypoxylus dichotomus]